MNHYDTHIPILVCAAGDRHRREAASFISRHPTLDVYVGSDRPLVGAAGHVQVMSKGYLAKIDAIINFDAREFLYVDTDVTIYSTTDVGFFLKRYPISASYEPLGSSENLIELAPPTEKSAPFEYQTGVLAIRKTPELVRFLETWKAIQEEGVRSNGSRFPDQVSLRVAAHRHDLPIGVMPQNMNYRFMYNQLISGSIRICHSRRPASYSMSEAIRADEAPRYLLSSRFSVGFQSPIMKLVRLIMRLG